jgi:hypothetical protein
MSYVSNRYYFVCDCGAKGFALAALVRCPRCGCQLISTERVQVPWRNAPLPSIPKSADRCTMDFLIWFL